MHLVVDIGGIPHLAKNERDMGHPSLVREPGAADCFVSGLDKGDASAIATMRELNFVGAVSPAQSGATSWLPPRGTPQPDLFILSIYGHVWGSSLRNYPLKESN